MIYNVINYLEQNNIEFYQSGYKNVSKGWLGINCIFCDDSSNHLGVSVEGGNFSCWKCEEKGSFVKLIMSLEKISYAKAKSISKKYIVDFVNKKKEIVVVKEKSKINLKKQFFKEFDKNCFDYFEKRNFNLDFLIKKYDLFYSKNLGNFKFRVIVPIIFNKQIVSFVGMSVLGKEPKYKFCSNESSLVNPNDIFYNFDNVTSDKLIIVEGITDVWRIGNNSIASFGKNITNKQIQFLFNKKEYISSIYIFLDPDAKDKAIMLSKKLSPFFKTYLITSNEKDPAEFSQKDIFKLKSSIRLS